MNGAIALFVKTPGLSPVKTRLASGLGRETAEAFHLASAQAVVAVMNAAAGLDTLCCYYAVAEKTALTHDCWRDLPCLWQGDGGLGVRMGHIYRSLLQEHDFVVLIGADTPQVTPSELLAASAWLLQDEQARLAFGPSADGGFWLFGGNRDIPDSLWTDVTYSVPDTGAQFFSRIEHLGQIQTLTTLCDVDEADDLVVLQRALMDLSNPLPSQQELLRFLQAIPHP